MGISQSGAVAFISNLFPGSIMDKKLTGRSGLLNLLEKGDCVVADCQFDIQDDLIPLGVNIKIPPFLKEKLQFQAYELV